MAATAGRVGGIPPPDPAALFAPVIRVLAPRLTGDRSARPARSVGRESCHPPGRPRPGRWAGLPQTSPCHLHLTSDVPLFQNVGVVDRIDERYGEHSVVVTDRCVGW
jgi:hypothetical protein